jgi:hypothetical protein
MEPDSGSLIHFAHGRQLGDEGSLAYVYVMLAQADILLGELDLRGS